MSVDLLRLHWIPIAIGLAFWLAALVAIWCRPKPDVFSSRELDFENWKNMTGQIGASFAEFLASEQTPRIYLSRASQSVVVTATALLVLFAALRSWGAVS